MKLEVSLVDALFGCDKIIDTIDGDQANINIKAGIQNDEKIIIKNKVK
jgi:DnaJ-class molecular chaperone